MISYEFIKDLFTAILKESKSIQGRFHIAHRYGAQEINSDALGELITEIGPKNKYPLALMVAPHSRIEYQPTDNATEWERYRIILFFVKTTYYGDGMPSNSKTKTSIHTVPQDWQDMKRSAEGFMRQLINQQRITPKSPFRVPKNQALYVPVSTVGADRVSGIKLDFDFDLFTGCQDLGDYTDMLPKLIINEDSHPQHSL